MEKDFIGVSERDKAAGMKKSRRREQLLALALLSPYLIIFILFTLVPFIMGFGYSFMRYNPYNSDEVAFLGFKNYSNLFNFDIAVTKSFWNSFGTMLLFDMVTVPLLMIIPFILAYFINMRPPFYKVFRAIIYLPCVVSITIVGIMFTEIFASDSQGLINSWFGVQIDWLGGKPFQNDFLRWFVILLASIWGGVGGNFVIFSGALRNIPKSLYEACEMDGGGRWQCITRVTLPNIKPALNITLFSTLIGFLNLYGQPTVLNTIENQDIFVSPIMFIQNYLSGIAYARQTGFICASAIIFGLIIMALGFIEQAAMAERRKPAKHFEACARYYKLRAQSISAEGGAK